MQYMSDHHSSTSSTWAFKSRLTAFVEAGAVVDVVVVAVAISALVDVLFEAFLVFFFFLFCSQGSTNKPDHKGEAN